MRETEEFEDIRPYYDYEAHEVLQRMVKDPLLHKIISYLWPDMSIETITEKAESINSIADFQLQFMHPAIRTIVDKSSAGLSSSGFENLEKGKNYIFVANHRDILLDSAILQVLLVEHGFPTSEITFGDNLMEPGFISDFGKINRMFTVKREGTSRELYEISKKISGYIRYTILQKKVSVWIAQGNGRTKDGNDITQTGLLKMLNISGKGNLVENFRELNIVPVTISYEYEPCDAFKAQELSLSTLHTKYIKAPGEDKNSIITGIVQNKGRIHLAMGKPLAAELDNLLDEDNDNEKIRKLALAIDKQVYEDFKVWPLNYVAADLLEESDRFKSFYTEEEKADFIKYINNWIPKLKGEPQSLYNKFLKIYGNPVLNKTHKLAKA
jgi:glycerol-3-phosphate O-acyltransferase